jgi:hypothetical protein
MLMFRYYGHGLLGLGVVAMFSSFISGTRWATPSSGFWGLLAGTVASVLHRLAYSSNVLHYGAP